MWGAQNWIRYSSRGLTSVEYRARISSLSLLAVQTVIPFTFFAARAYCWSSWCPPSQTVFHLGGRGTPWCLELFLSRCRTLHFLLKLMMLLLALVSNLSRSLWTWNCGTRAVCPSGTSRELGEPLLLEPPSYNITLWFGKQPRKPPAVNKARRLCRICHPGISSCLASGALF